MIIQANLETMTHVFGANAIQQMIAENNDPSCDSGSVNAFGANVYMTDNKDTYRISEHHSGEAQETAAKIDAAKTRDIFQTRPSTQLVKNGYRAIVVREKWNYKTQKFGAKKVIFVGIETYRNRNVGESAKHAAYQLHKLIK